MWFKNLQLFRLPADWAMEADTLAAQLGRQLFQSCGSMEMVSRGWLSPTGDERLVHAVGRQWLLAMAEERKLLPASVINQVTQERAQDLEEKQGYRLGRKQLKELREQVTDELLPRAFSHRRRIHVWIDPAHGWLAVDAASQARAEEVLELLNKCLDELPARRLQTERSPVAAMTDWLAGGEAPAGFTVDRDCELKSVTEEKSAVRYVRHPLDGDEIRDHLVAGKLPTRLAMTWNDRVSFVLTDKLELKRLDFLDLVKEEAAQADSAAEEFDASFALMSGELAKLLPDLLDALGGESPAAV